MARDRTRNAYFTIGIPLGSQTYADLKADAEETGISIALLLGVRIADWYSLARRGVVLAPRAPHQEAGSTTEERQEAASSPIQERALAAAAVWGGDDD